MSRIEDKRVCKWLTEDDRLDQAAVKALDSFYASSGDILVNWGNKPWEAGSWVLRRSMNYVNDTEVAVAVLNQF